MKKYQRVLSLLLCLVVFGSSFGSVHIAKAVLSNPLESVIKGVAGAWMENKKGFVEVKGRDYSIEWPWGGGFSSTVPRDYYTICTNSVEDKNGNVTNYYRGGDTTNLKVIDSYNKTFNTIHNTTNTTNNYKANVRLSDFLNNYTTNNITNTVNNKYTYSADFKSWYYDNTTNNYTFNEFTKNDYTQNNLYYNQDNSQYYITIDNSTDEYYLVDVQYSPTFTPLPSSRSITPTTPPTTSTTARSATLPTSITINSKTVATVPICQRLRSPDWTWGMMRRITSWSQTIPIP